MICAAPTFTGTTIAAMPEACFERVAATPGVCIIAASTRRCSPCARRRGTTSTAWCLRTPCARRLARGRRSCARPRWHRSSDWSPRRTGGVALDADHWFVRALCEGAGEPRAAVVRASRARVYCAARTRARRGPEPRVLDALFTPGSLRADRAGAGGGRAPPAIVADFTRRGRPTDAANGTVAGFVAPGDEDVDWIRNGDFARGWDGWETEGRVALASAESRPDACNGLTAAVAPGPRSRNACRSRRARVREACRPISRSASRPPRPDRELRSHSVGTSGSFRYRPGARPSRRPLPSPGATADDPVLQIRVYPAPRPRRSSSGRCASPSARPPGFDRFAPRASLPCSRAERRRRPRVRTTPDARGPRAHLAQSVTAARVTTGGETFARVVPQKLEAEDGPRGGDHGASRLRPLPDRRALASPGGTCPRHLRASVALAAECRGTSDGVDFAVRGGRPRAPCPPTRERRGAARRARPRCRERDERAGARPRPPPRPRATRTIPAATGRSGSSRSFPVVGSDREATRAVPPAVARACWTSSARSATAHAFATRWDEVNLWSSTPTSAPSAPSAAQRPAMQPDGLPRAVAVGHARAQCSGRSAATPADTSARTAAEGAAPRPSLRRTLLGRRRAARRAVRDPARRGTGGRAGRVDVARRHRRPARERALPHLNVSAVPCALGRRPRLSDVPLNQRPVRDHDHWRRYVAYVAAQIASAPNLRRVALLDHQRAQLSSGSTARARRTTSSSTSASWAPRPTTLRISSRRCRPCGRQLPGMRVQLGDSRSAVSMGSRTISPSIWGCSATSWCRPAWPRAISARCRSASTRRRSTAWRDLGPTSSGRLRRWIGPTSPFRGIPGSSTRSGSTRSIAGPFEERTTSTSMGRAGRRRGMPTSWHWRFARAWYPSLHG